MGLAAKHRGSLEPGQKKYFVRARLSCLNPVQIAWLSIGLASLRFRSAWVLQGRSLDDLAFRASWTWPWGPMFVVCSRTFSGNYDSENQVYQIITVAALIISECRTHSFQAV